MNNAQLVKEKIKERLRSNPIYNKCISPEADKLVMKTIWETLSSFERRQKKVDSNVNLSKKKLINKEK